MQKPNTSEWWEMQSRCCTNCSRLHRSRLLPGRLIHPWQIAHHVDASLRRSLYRLLVVCAANYTSSIPWPALSTSILSKALSISQLGSSSQFVEALTAVTKVRPEIWTDDYTAKTPVTRRLLQFLRRGSERGTADYWTGIHDLLRRIPSVICIPSSGDPDEVTVQDCKTLLEALHVGIQSADEPRPNLTAAWRVYTKLCFWLMDKVKPEWRADELATDCLLPLLEQYIGLEHSRSQWSIPSNVSL